MATIGIGSKLEYESGSTWVEVENCKTIGVPQFNVSIIDTVHLGLTDYGMTFMPGMIDPGACPFEAEFTTTTYTALQGIIAERSKIGWRVTAEDEESGLSVVVTCDGFLT